MKQSAHRLFKAPTRFELVIEVLQTFALPLGYGAIFNSELTLNDSDGNRTRVTAVKGRCLNRLTTEPYVHISNATEDYVTIVCFIMQAFFNFYLCFFLIFC